MNPLKVAHNEGRKNDKFLKSAFARYLGSSQHPRGQILSIYRRGRREMKSAFSAERYQIPLLVNDVLTNMRREILSVAGDAVADTTQHGLESARVQAEVYPVFQAAGEFPNTQALVDGFIAPFDEQARSIRALVNSGNLEPERIIGDGGRLGILQPAPVNNSGAGIINDALATAMLVWWSGRDTRIRDPKYKKQAFAVVDEKTTQTCLHVNGQIRDFNKKFKLSPHTPRFADFMQWSPFHHYCRTTIVLYLADFDFGITEGVIAASQAEIARRARQ